MGHKYNTIYDLIREQVSEHFSPGPSLTEIFSTIVYTVFTHIVRDSLQKSTSLDACLSQGMFQLNGGELPAKQTGPTEEPTNGYQL